jgi:hypothetical protein
MASLMISYHDFLILLPLLPSWLCLCSSYVHKGRLMLLMISRLFIDIYIAGNEISLKKIAIMSA